MNIESRIDHVKGLRTQIIRGETKLSEIKAFLETLYQSGEFDPKLHALWDVREAGFPEVTQVEIKEMAYFARIHWAEKHHRKTAIVISGDYHFGLSRMFEQFVGPHAHGKIKTFRDVPTAVDWIAAKYSTMPFPTNG